MAKKKSGKAAEAPAFEEAMGRLENIVRELEESDLPLEKSLQIFEEGVSLSRLLNSRLNEAEKRVEILLRDEKGGTTAVPFNPEEEGAEPEEDDGDTEQEKLF